MCTGNVLDVAKSRWNYASDQNNSYIDKLYMFCIVFFVD